jgi:hypothetical protein
MKLEIEQMKLENSTRGASILFTLKMCAGPPISVLNLIN